MLIVEKPDFMLYPKDTKFFFSTNSSRIRAMVLSTEGDAVYCATSHGIDVFENNRWRNISQTKVNLLLKLMT